MSIINSTSGIKFFAAVRWAIVSTTPISIPKAFLIISSPYPVTAEETIFISGLIS